MADLTRSDVLRSIRGLLDLTVRPDCDADTYSLITDRIAALALVLRELPADPAVRAPVAEPAPAQDPACPYPPVMTRWGMATWRKDGTEWVLFAPGFDAADFIASAGGRYINVWGGPNGSGAHRGAEMPPDPMPALLAALRELGSLPDEVTDAP